MRGMGIDMDEAKLQTVAQVRTFLAGTQFPMYPFKADFRTYNAEFTLHLFVYFAQLGRRLNDCEWIQSFLIPLRRLLCARPDLIQQLHRAPRPQRIWGCHTPSR